MNSQLPIGLEGSRLTLILGKKKEWNLFSESMIIPHCHIWPVEPLRKTLEILQLVGCS